MLKILKTDAHHVGLYFIYDYFGNYTKKFITKVNMLRNFFDTFNLIFDLWMSKNHCDVQVYPIYGYI